MKLYLVQYIEWVAEDDGGEQRLERFKFFFPVNPVRRTVIFFNSLHARSKI